LGTGCKKFRDINTNPNNPDEVVIQLVLPSAQAAIAQAVGGKFQIIGGIWGQYWTQNPSAAQYRIFEQYQIDGSEVNRAWNAIYADALTDLDQIIKKSSGQKNYSAIAKILKAYAFHVMTDQFGDIPFSEALKAEEGINSPKYDTQEDVYKGIIALVKEGLDEMDEASPIPDSDDLIYHGDMGAWQRFANTLLLKVYMRLSERSPAFAQSGIEEITANGIGFLEAGETAQIVYSNEAGNYNPLYSEMNNSVIGGIQNLIASSTAIDSFVSNNDPRIEVFYTPGSGGFIGLPQGDYGSSVPGTTIAYPGAAVGGDAHDDASAVAPVIFISDYESLFLQAEAAARGWASGSAAELFTEAINANFAAYGLDATDYLASSPWAQYPVDAPLDAQLRHIITQKWFSMCGNQNLESWTEWRRTGYPNFFVYSPNSRIGKNFPVRMPYPDDEVTNNLNFPGQKQVTDKVWWDVD